MRIHTDKLTQADIYAATKAGGMRGVYTETESRKGSRSRDHAFEVTLRGTSNRRPNWGTGDRDTDPGFAATWDEWGMFIQALYEIDPEAIIGQYPNKDVFERVTFDRFVSLTQPYQHPNHKFEYNADRGHQACKGCEAEFDWTALRLSNGKSA